jgi:hypothetical protein
VGAEEDRNSNPVCQMQICEEERLQQIQMSTGLHQTMTLIGSHEGCVWGWCRKNGMQTEEEQRTSLSVCTQECEGTEGIMEIHT